MKTFYYRRAADPDSNGVLSMVWEDPAGPFRREIHFDGEPVGHRRGQCFNDRTFDALKTSLEAAGHVLRPWNEAPERLRVTRSSAKAAKQAEAAERARRHAVARAGGRRGRRTS